MGVTAVAAMVPGGGAMVKAGFAAARAGGRVAAKVGKAVAKPFKKGCNSFTPDTGVLMADGTTQPISDIDVGDLVAARDPVTGELTTQPVLHVIVGFGDKHLIGVTTIRGPPGSNMDAGDEDSWIATANHPIWVEGSGWTNAEKLEVGDVTTGANGERRLVSSITDYGWLPAQTVYNVSVANVHTFLVGSRTAGTLVHNSSSSCPSIRLNPEAFEGASRSAVKRALRQQGFVHDRGGISRGVGARYTLPGHNGVQVILEKGHRNPALKNGHKGDSIHGGHYMKVSRGSGITWVALAGRRGVRHR
jgi:hypothetical protein